MKRTLCFTALAIMLLLASCKKSSDSTINLINCDGLITDTAGTGDNGRIYIPNAFSPNGDGVNDIYRPYLKNIASIVFTIYDATNTVVFTTNVLGQAWQPAVSGGNYAIRYYFKIQAVTVSGRHIGMCGDVYKLNCFPAGVPKSSLYFEDQLLPSGVFSGTTIESLPNCL